MRCRTRSRRARNDRVPASTHCRSRRSAGGRREACRSRPARSARLETVVARPRVAAVRIRTPRRNSARARGKAAPAAFYRSAGGRMISMFRKLIVITTLAIAAPASAQVDARMFRQPAVSADKIAFVYAGDIWLVPKAGGTAVRLSSPAGEESFPRFSPDGARLAYSADYDGNTDVYVVPTAGGAPVRLTHHPMADRVIGWHPDGTRVLFASARESGRQRYNQFYLVGVDGGLPEKLPVPYGEFGAFSPDATSFVYMPMAQDFRNWKRYRGGWAPDLMLFDLKSFATRNITSNPANDAQPMWHGNTIYFVSDRGANERNNVWAYEVGAGKVRQVTDLADFDITFPSSGPDSMVFQAGGRLYILDFGSEKTKEVPVRVVTDETTLRPRTAKVEPLIQSASVSP